MAWFERKAKKKAENIIRRLEEPAPTPATDRLQGDEKATTPIEGDALGKLAHLHPFSPVALALIRLFDREETDTKEIVDLIGSDATLAAETLAYVNSPLFGIKETITSLKHAVTVLGADNTRSLATTLATRSVLESAPKPAVVRRIWKHSIATAVIASELAPIYGVTPGLANTAGVLHDIGRMGLLAQYGEMYARLVFSLYDDVDAILKEEREVCALDHCDVGNLLGKAWKLPEVFQEVAAKHHRPAGDAGVLGLIHTACGMADTLGFAAIAYRKVPTTEEWVDQCEPEGLRPQIASRWRSANPRIAEKIGVLDF